MYKICAKCKKKYDEIVHFVNDNEEVIANDKLCPSCLERFEMVLSVERALQNIGNGKEI